MQNPLGHEVQRPLWPHPVVPGFFGGGFAVLENFLGGGGVGSSFSQAKLGFLGLGRNSSLKGKTRLFPSVLGALRVSSGCSGGRGGGVRSGSAGGARFRV